MAELDFSLTLTRPRFRLHAKAQIANGVTALLGHSGAGKSSLLRAIAGLETAQGHIRLGAQHWLTPRQQCPVHQRGVGVVFQGQQLLPGRTVAGNLSYAWQRRHSEPWLTENELVQRFALAPLLHQRVEQLSVGQAQRVAIARAIASAPHCLLLDEPLSALDSDARAQLTEQLGTLLAQQPIPVLWVSHHWEEITQIAQQALVLRQGEVVAQDTLERLSCQLAGPLSQGPDSGSIVAGRVQAIADDDLAQIVVDPELRLWLPKGRLQPGQAVKLRLPARDISLTLHPPQHSSILNILPGRILALGHAQGGQQTLSVRCGGQILLATLTQRSVTRLCLQPGQPVYLQVKGVALLHHELNPPAEATTNSADSAAVNCDPAPLDPPH